MSLSLLVNLFFCSFVINVFEYQLPTKKSLRLVMAAYHSWHKTFSKVMVPGMTGRCCIWETGCVPCFCGSLTALFPLLPSYSSPTSTLPQASVKAPSPLMELTLFDQMVWRASCKNQWFSTLAAQENCLDNINKYFCLGLSSKIMISCSSLEDIVLSEKSG